MKPSTDIQTITGNYFDYSNFSEKDISEIDVAYALNKICRFNGHCQKYYSVAKHLCLVHDLMEYARLNLSHPINSEHVFHGLIHDVGEAYLTDIPRPLKNYFAEFPEFGKFMENYIKLEDKIINLFSLKFGHSEHSKEIASVVKFYDNWALRIEQKNIMLKTSRKWDNEKVNFPDDPPFVSDFFVEGLRSIDGGNWAKQFLKRLKQYADIETNSG